MSASLGRTRPEAVHPAQDALVAALGLVGHGIGFVLDGHVVEDVLLVDIHPPDAVSDDDGEFEGKGGVVGLEVGHRVGEEVGVAVLVLESLSVEGGPSGRPADHEAARADVACGPDQITDALHPEHGVEDEEGNGVDAVGGVRGAGRNEGAHGAGLGDALLEELAVLGLLVVHERSGVDGFIELAGVRVDPDLPEERLGPEGARFVGDDGHDELADLGIFEEFGEQANKSLSGRDRRDHRSPL